MRRGVIGVVVIAAVLALVFGLARSSPSRSTSKRTTPTNGSTSRLAHPTSTSTAKTPATAAVSHKPVKSVCPPATPAGAKKRVIAFTTAPPDCIAKTGVYDATVKTDVGTFVIRMNAASSYAAVNNFVFLARYHVVDGITFHRVIKGFVVQGGDPTGTGSGGPGYEFTGNTPPASCTAKKDCYPAFSVAMANSGGSPKTDGSQFFIVLPGGGTALNPNPVYTEFGQVVKGQAVVAKIGADGASASAGATGTPTVLHHMVKVTITKVA